MTLIQINGICVVGAFSHKTGKKAQPEGGSVDPGLLLEEGHAHWEALSLRLGYTQHAGLLTATQDCVLPTRGLLMALVTLSPESSMAGAHQHLLNKLLAERCRWKNPFSAVLSTSQRPRNRTQGMVG